MRKKLLPLAMLAATTRPRAQPDPIAVARLTARARRFGSVLWLDDCDSTEVLDWNVFLSPEDAPKRYSLFNGSILEFLNQPPQEKYAAYELKPQLIYPMPEQAQ